MTNIDLNDREMGVRLPVLVRGFLKLKNNGYLKVVVRKIVFGLELLHLKRSECSVNILPDTYPYYMMFPSDLWELEYFTPVKSTISCRYRNLKLK